MSCWIEFHAARIKRLKKFSDFRKDLSLSVNEALGLLGSFWGEAIELAESGDISGWTPEYVAERAGSNLNPERVWKALVQHRWVDIRGNGTFVIHDWLDCAGTFLRGKYAGSNKLRLQQIWALHGRVYAQKGNSTDNQLDSNGKPITPLEVGLGKGDGDVDGGPGEGEGPWQKAFDLARKVYPGTKRGFEPEWANFKRKYPRFRDIIPKLIPAIERETANKDALKAAKKFCPGWKNFQTWINQSCWTQEFPAVEAASGADSQHPARRESQSERQARAAEENYGPLLKPKGGHG